METKSKEMIRKYVISAFIFTLLLSCSTNRSSIPTFSWNTKANTPDLSWAKDVGAKSYPTKKNIINACDYGAIGDGSSKNTLAIQKAIDACEKAGGGQVILNKGKYLTGGLFIKSNVDLHISKGVMLLASEDINDYPEFPTRVAGIEMTWPSAVINIINQKNASLSGKGEIDCRGKVFWDKYWAMRKEYEKKDLRWIIDYDCKRVRGILVSNSSDVTLKDFTLIRTGFWGTQILYSDHCTISGLTINNNVGGHGPSTDGIDIDSSTRILIEKCDIDCNDDNICIKSGRDADGLRVNRPTEYVVIRNCKARKGAGLITCGSETSGSIRNILGYNLEAVGNASILRLKSALNRGGVVENIYMDGVKGSNIGTVFAADLNWNPSYSYSTLPPEYKDKTLPNHWVAMLTPVSPKEKGYPYFRNVYMSNVKADSCKQFISASGWSDSLRLKDFHFYNINVSAEKVGNINFTEGFTLKNIKIKTDKKAKLVVNNNNRLSENINYE